MAHQIAGAALDRSAIKSGPFRLSKSKLIAGRQCERRIWLEVHRPELREFDDAQSARLKQGTAFGELARGLLGSGELIESGFDIDAALQKTSEALSGRRPPRHVFEAAFKHSNVVVRVDALRRMGKAFELIEVKSATRVKDYFLDDCAVQTWVAHGSGIDVRRTRVALVNRDFIYREAGNYNGLLKFEDVTRSIEARLTEVPRWLRRFRKVLDDIEPAIHSGAHCQTPYGCPFIERCQQSDPPRTEFPLALFPNSAGLAPRLALAGYGDLRDVPDEALAREQHRRMVAATRSGHAIIEAGLRDELAALPYPRRYLDFEAIQFVVPRWLSTRPFDQIPFQWSCHLEKASGDVEAMSFLDLTGDDPRRGFAESLVKACGRRGPILVYNRCFESMCLSALARHCPDLADQLVAIRERLVDLLPLMRKHYYHPDMHGSWSLKAVLPTIVPALDYDNLGEVADGAAAQNAYLDATAPATDVGRRQSLREALVRYCERDTLGLIEIVRAFSG